MEEIKFNYGGKSYSITIKNIGQESCSPRKKIEQRKRSYHTLHFIWSGFGTLYSNENKILLNKGNAFLLYAQEEYNYYPDSFDPWSYIWVDFIGDDLEDLFDACGFSKDKPFVRIGDYSAVMDIFKQLVENYDSTDLHSITCSAYLMLLFGKLIEYKNRLIKSNEKTSAFYKQFREVITYINNNYRMNLSLGEIAETMCISERQLIYMFNINVGMTPINYINNFKVSYACDYLKQSDLKIEDISHLIGIDDVAYFTRLFTKCKGLSPRAYRKNCIDDDPFAWLKEKNLDLR